jgi:anion-transporting  ArsA/GET3 family ATPase
MKPTRAGLKVVGVAAQALLRTISKVAGADIVQDAVSFFQAFEGMEEGFRERASRVRELLAADDTAFVLVASPRSDSVDEAVHFAGKLAEADMSVTALVVNRVQPRFADDDQLARLPPPPGPGSGTPLDELIENLAGYTAASDREERATADLVAKIAPAPVYRVPLLNGDVHDVAGLGTIADLLFGRSGPESAGGTAAIGMGPAES